ncbi:hypothetical protein [Idiomarina sp.]|uniref:hypothetical protein n=1 Tax=Idiomarina sp. TaxID=1874361 RepID=UPI0025C149FD|nr:hypothetical protein [Idiomarina sp.]
MRLINLKLLGMVYLSLALTLILALPVSAQQSVSQRLAEQLQSSAADQLNADLWLAQLQVNALTDELSADDVRLATRVEALSEPLNQLIIADTIRMSGNWQVLGQRQVSINEVSLSGAQLTVAYYATGQSNLHTLIEQIQEQAVRFQPASLASLASLDNAIDWQLQTLRFTDVTINLFDRGEPIASVHVPSLELNELNQGRSTEGQVDGLIFPIIEQLLRQWRQGQSSGADNIQIDGPALTRFLMREALAF